MPASGQTMNPQTLESPSDTGCFSCPSLVRVKSILKAWQFFSCFWWRTSKIFFMIFILFSKFWTKLISVVISNLHLIFNFTRVPFSDSQPSGCSAQNMRRDTFFKFLVSGSLDWSVDVSFFQITSFETL